MTSLEWGEWSDPCENYQNFEILSKRTRTCPVENYCAGLGVEYIHCDKEIEPKCCSEIKIDGFEDEKIDGIYSREKTQKYKNEKSGFWLYFSAKFNLWVLNEEISDLTGTAVASDSKGPQSCPQNLKSWKIIDRKRLRKFSSFWLYKIILILKF